MTLNEIMENYGVDTLNSITKYPSILTYHNLGEKGCLKNSLVDGKSFENEQIFVTEKIDGTNSRIIICGDDYIIGSREQLLYAKGDRFGDPAQNIVASIKSIADGFSSMDGITVLYGETYGGNITAASKQYTNTKQYSYRLFDIVTIKSDEIQDLFSLDLSQISSWRERAGQNFYAVDELLKFGKKHDLPTVPYLTTMNGSDLPTSLGETYSWLSDYTTTQAGIDASGQSEGVVVRTVDRSMIRKIRFADYERTKKRFGLEP